MSKKCPRCGLQNDDRATHCDCGRTLMDLDKEYEGNTHWFYKDQEKVHGPVRLEVLRERLASGELQPTAEVRCMGTLDWVPAQSVAALRRQLPSTEDPASGQVNAAGRVEEKGEPTTRRAAIHVTCCCGSQWEVDDSLAGKQILCSTCDQRVTVPRPPEFGPAPSVGLPAPLGDPLRALRILLGCLMLIQIALAIYLLTTRAHNEATVVLSAGAILLTFAFWRVLPNRPVNAFYLRSFRHDTDTWAMRQTLAAVLGPRFRLSGIRDPQRRSIKLLRYLTLFLFALRYVTPKYMNLEAGPSWKRRLWRSLGDARLAVIDISDLTPFVAEEVRLCARCLGLSRILFVGHTQKDAETWQAEINQVLNRPPDAGSLHLALWPTDSSSGREAFEAEVRRFAAQVPEEPAGLRHDAFPLSRSQAPGLWKRLNTPLNLSEGWVWGELLLGLALAGGLWMVFRHQLHGGIANMTRSNPGDLWSLPVLGISVVGLALCELWHLLLYLKDCGAFRERCLTLVTFGLPVVAPLYVAVEHVREAAARVQCANNLKTLALALDNYATDHDSRFPDAASYDPTGKPLLSWRVAVLPYLEQEDLYKEFHLKEPWDSRHNLSLVARMPKVYAFPWARRKTPPGHTYFRVFVSSPTAQPRAAFLNGAPTWRGLFANVPSQPILVVEAEAAVPWTKPEELEYDPNKPLQKLGGHFRGVFHAVLPSGKVKVFPSDMPEADLRGWITSDGHKVIPDR